MFPFLLGQPVLTFVVYAVILDCADYWRHRLSHRVPLVVGAALAASRAAADDVLVGRPQPPAGRSDRALWFGVIALLIGVPPMQFPLLVLVLRFVESLSHANARLSFGWLGERLLVSPRFHRAHHGMLAAGQRSCNYGAVLPWWDMLFGTADFSRDYVRDRRSDGRGGAGHRVVSGSSNGPECGGWQGWSLRRRHMAQDADRRVCRRHILASARTRMVMGHGADAGWG